ncbi:MAG: hypothetical protein RIR70_736, partial [Pseudomonadota bacterium]
QESVTSPPSEVRSLASTMSHFSTEVQSVRRPVFSPPGTEVILPISVPASRASALVSSRAGATVREQIRNMQPGSGAYSAAALRQMVIIGLTAGPFLGAGVGLTVAFLKTSIALAVGVSSLLFLIGGILVYQGLRRGLENLRALSPLARPIELEPLRLEREIAFWQRAAGQTARPRSWHRDRSEEAKHFAAFLGKLEYSRDFSQETSRALVVARVNALLEDMGKSRTLRRRVFQIAIEYAESCTDRVALGLNFMEIAVSARKAEKGLLPERALLEKMRGYFRLEQLEKFARDEGIVGQVRQRGGVPDDVETMVNLQMRLRESLDLPLPRFTTARASSELTLARLMKAGEFVQESERANYEASRDIFHSKYRAIFNECKPLSMRDPGQWPKLAVFIAQNAAWGAHVVRTYPQAWRDHQVAAHRYQAALDDYFAKHPPSPVMFDGLDYAELSKRSGFYANYGLALEKALDALSEPPV